MAARPVLDLEAGEPRWYQAAVGALLATVIAALIVTPLRWPYTLGVLAAAATALGCTWLQRRGRARFRRLQVYSDHSLALIDHQGEELAVVGNGRSWVSPLMIVLPLRLPSGSIKYIVIARDRNSPDAFRRFTVICRFGFAVETAERHNGVQINTSRSMM